MEIQSYIIETFYIVLCCLAFRCYAVQSGRKDALIYSKKGADSLPTNEHKIFTLERTIIFMIFCL